MEQINVYSAQELKEMNPVAFQYAWEKYKRICESDTLPWQEEIMDSMKKTFKYAGITLKDWSIGAYSPSYVKISIPTYWSDLAENDELVDNLESQLAVDWLKETFDIKSFERVEYTNHLDKQAYRYDFKKLDGEDWSCEFTGYCADFDFLESLFESVICDGMNIEDAFRNLADVASKLFENEYEYMMSEEYFLEQSECNDWKYTEDGTQI